MTENQTSPFPTDSTTKIVNSAIDGVFSAAVKAAEAALVASNPAFFGNPIVEKIDDKVIELVAAAIYKNFSLWVSFEILDFKDSHEVTDEKKALVALKAAQKSGDKNAITQALKDFNQAVGKLTVFDGAAQPGSL